MIAVNSIIVIVLMVANTVMDIRQWTCISNTYDTVTLSGKTVSKRHVNKMLAKWSGREYLLAVAGV